MTLSIITINYNNKSGLLKTIESICSQSWHGYEWIVIDGGSTDGSRELIESHADEMAYWCSEPDNGIYNAMNKGIAKAKGDYLNFMNSGDTFCSPNTLYDIFGRKADFDADIIHGNYYDIYDSTDKIARYTKNNLDLCDLMFCPINHQSTFIKRELLQAEGYDETYRLLADWKSFIQWMVEGKTFEHIDAFVACFDMNGSHTTEQKTKEKEIQRIKEEVIPSNIQTVCTELHNYRTTFSTYPELNKVSDLFQRSDIMRKLISHFTGLLATIERIIH